MSVVRVHVGEHFASSGQIPDIRSRSFAAFTSAMQSALGSCLSVWERSRQPEPWEHAVVEAGAGADPVAGEGEDDEADRMADAGGGAKVGPERRLAIGSRRDEVKPSTRA